MSKFLSFFLAGVILILLITGFLILVKNNLSGIIFKPLATIKEVLFDLFTFSQPGTVDLPIVEKEDLKEKENIKEEENLQKEPDISSELNIDEIVEKLDEISEKIDLLTQEVEKLLGKEIEKSEFSEETEKEDKNEVSEEEKLEEVEDESEQIAEEAKTPEKDIILCEKGGQSPVRDKIILNEISWMGTNSDWRNEWIELKNISNSEISLKGWQILDEEQEIKIIFEQKDKILANQFFLLERTNDDTVPNISADKIYSGNLNDEDEILYLFDENCLLQDEILANPNWPAGDKNERKSMERDSDLTWYTYSGGSNYGIFGTPKAENSPKFVFSSSGGGSSPPEEEIPAAPPPKILISEIFFDAEGSDEEQEFIELFNPNDSEVDLSSHSIQYLNSSADSIDKIEKKNLEEGNKIEAKNYFLVGLNGREGDIKWSKSLGNTGGTVVLVNNKEPISGDNDENVVDRIGYGSGEGLILPETSAMSLENFEAGKSLGRKWLEETEEYQDSDNNQEDFEIQNPTPKEKNQNLLPPLQPIVEDSIAPQVSFDAISSLQIETSFSLSWIGQDFASGNVTPSGIDGFYLKYDIIDAESTVTASDIDGIAIQYQDNNNNWQDWEKGEVLELMEEKNTLALLGKDGYTYLFQIQAEDKAENVSGLVEVSTTLSLISNIKINEVCAGLEKAENEFLELFNPLDSDINLNNRLKLKLVNSSNKITTKKISWKINSIPGKGFFLIGSEDLPIAVDAYYHDDSITGTSGVVIVDKNDIIIDRIGWGNVPPADAVEGEGINIILQTGQSLERKESGLDTDNNNLDFILNATPTPQNSEYIP